MGPDKVIEVTPGPARRGAKEAAIVRRQNSAAPAFGRPINQDYGERKERPQKEEWSDRSRCGWSVRQRNEKEQDADGRDPKSIKDELRLPVSGALVGVLRGLPFEQQAMRFQAPVGDAHDGFERHAGVIRQEKNGEGRTQQTVARFPPKPRPGRRRSKEEPDDGIKSRPEHEPGNNRAPHQRRRGQKPAREKKRDGRRRDEAAAQIIEDLPLVEGGKRVWFRSPASRGHAPFQPIDDLPVAADPAMLPVPPRDVTAWENIQQLDIRRQTDAHMAAFEKIVTEQMRLGKSFRKQTVKSPQFVDAFAVITAFANQVLVNIGDGVGVGIDPARIGKDA